MPLNTNSWTSRFFFCVSILGGPFRIQFFGGGPTQQCLESCQTLGPAVWSELTVSILKIGLNNAPQKGNISSSKNPFFRCQLAVSFQGRVDLIPKVIRLPYGFPLIGWEIPIVTKVPPVGGFNISEKKKSGHIEKTTYIPKYILGGSSQDS